MKINERTLVSYSTSQSTPTDKQGWLWKRGEVNKNFQKRFFVLKGNLLFYFEKERDKEPVGVIILEGCVIELAEEEQEKFAFKIAFHGDGKRVYVLGTDTQSNLEEWMKILACASYEYMKLMVVELQQQLSELEDLERQSLANASASSVSNGGSLSPTSASAGVEPRAPPRTRPNPFNSVDEGGKKVPRKTWTKMHHELGVRVERDRSVWIAAHGPLVSVKP